MPVTQRIVNYVGGKETFVSTFYFDPTGTGTIGYGFTWGSKIFQQWWMAKYGRKMQRGDTISKPDADALLGQIITQEYAPPVDKKFATVPASNVHEGAYSGVFNCGAGALKWSWAGKIAKGDLHGGAAAWRVTATTSRGKRLPGLVTRRQEEGDIIEFNRWPAWVSANPVVPARQVDTADIKQAQIWLSQLGYNCGPADGIMGPRTIQMVRQFQTNHSNLVVDGIVGAATLSALQRAVDLKSKGTKVAAGGTAVTAGGVLDKSTNADQAAATLTAQHSLFGDILLWGGIAIIVLGLAYLAWKYRDEIAIAVRKI